MDIEGILNEEEPEDETLEEQERREASTSMWKAWQASPHTQQIKEFVAAESVQLLSAAVSAAKSDNQTLCYMSLAKLEILQTITTELTREEPHDNE